jgi:hypothetical protein
MVMAAEVPAPADTCDQFVKAPIWTGLERLIMVLSPTRPVCDPAPQAQRVPSVLRATQELTPADTCDQFVKTPIWTGLERLIMVLSPSWPLPFSPHVQRVPSVLTALVKEEVPVSTCDQFVKTPIWTGLDLLITLPSPSWPLVLLPHPYNFPSVVVARV